ncbi:MAG: hypothetical protein NC395_04775 [Prevotella sp.]|nr:hypothetical protein [Prevotella sp.]
MDNSVNLSGIYSKISGNYINSNTVEEETDETNSYMSFDSYLKLLVAQMQNQDFNNPMDDSEVLAQMAQYSMLEGIKNMTQQSSISYATSLVGKVVTVDDGSGAYTGVVESVTVKNGEPYLMIDGMSYKSGNVTDIVAEEVFSLMMSLIGKTVQSVNADSATAVTGVVTNVVYQGGEAYAVVNDKLVAISSLKLAETEDGEGEDTEGTEDADGVEGAESVTGTEGEEGTEKDSGADTGDGTVTETEEVVETAAAVSYTARSESLINTFMKELDEAGGVSAASEVSETQMSLTAAAGADTEEYYVELMELEVPEYGAGIIADDETFTNTVSPDGVDKTFGSGSGSGTISRTVSNPNSYSTNYSSSYSSDTKPAVTKGDGIPVRKMADAYPEEAALADRLGTRMYDIRFINNRAITSRIKTDTVIGHSSSGKPVTEIGYSGVGQLGEVVTFADGTQRVEILLKNGHSGWLTTSGRLTLDQICTRTGEAGSLTGKLTAEESAIRHFSDPLAELDQSLRNSFYNYVSRNSV